MVLDQVAFADDALASSIVLVDLVDGAWRALAQAAPGYHPWTPVIRGDVVSWVEWRYAKPPASGSCTWRILIANLKSGRTKVVASGTNSRKQGDGAPPPPLAVDDTRLAFATQSTSSGRPFGWQIKVLDFTTGLVERTIDTQMEIYSLGLSGGAVAYSEGLVDQGRGFVYQTHLMLSTPEQPAPRQIAADAFELSFRDGRLAWVADQYSSQNQSGLARAQRVWTATGPNWQTTAVTVEPENPSEQQMWPAASSIGVGFTVADFSTGDLKIWLWDPATRLASPVPGSDGAILSDYGSGWLTFTGILEDSVTVSGIPWP